MTQTTATAKAYATELGMFHKYDASFIHGDELVHVTAYHDKDVSTHKYYEHAPRGVLVSVRTITNGKRSKGRKLNMDQRKIMLEPDYMLVLNPTT